MLLHNQNCQLTHKSLLPTNHRIVVYYVPLTIMIILMR